MPDIFISYKNEERSIAAQLATRLTEAGYDVWWDAALLAGERFEDEISSVLTASRAVIVLWSRKAIASDWVKAEAESARQQQKVLPVIIDDLPLESLPLLFRGLHAAHLQNWTGAGDHPGVAELMSSIKERLGAPKGPELSAPQAEAKLAENVSEAEIWAAISVGNPSADEYRAYLKRFGRNARFADLAKIRIARLEVEENDERPAKRKRKVRRNWMPAVVLPLLAILVIASVAGWLWLRGGNSFSIVTDMLVPAEVKTAAANCTAWANSASLDWVTTLPRLEATTATDCETAQAKLPNNGDYDAMLAMVRVLQGGTRADEGIALARKGIDLKSGLANYVMGVMYARALKLQADPIQAASYYKTASEMGVPRAAAQLCLTSIDNRGMLPFSATPDEIFGYCRAANDANDALGQIAMGYFYEHGDYNLQIDSLKAAELYGKAADQGSFVGKVRLGAMLVHGVGITPDPSKAFALFREAADSGLPEGLRWLGVAYETGIGTAPDLARAAQLYETASVRQDVVALMLAGYGIAPGIVSTPAAEREVERIGDDTSSAIGQRMAGEMYHFGYLRQFDNIKGSQLLTQCSDAANSFCQQQLGYLYEYGLIGPRDPVHAMTLFQASADQGNIYGQYWLAYLYDIGDGVARDADKAIELYRKAAAQGHLAAINRLKQLGVG